MQLFINSDTKESPSRKFLCFVKATFWCSEKSSLSEVEILLEECVLGDAGLFFFFFFVTMWCSLYGQRATPVVPLALQTHTDTADWK